MKTQLTTKELISRILKGVLLACLIITLFLPFLPGMGYEGHSFGTAFNYIFGSEIKLNEDLVYSNGYHSPLALVGYNMLLLSLALIVAMLFLRRSKTRLIIQVSAIITLLVSSIMLLCVHKECAIVIASNLRLAGNDKIVETIIQHSELLAGFIATSVMGFVTIATLIINMIFDQDFKQIKERDLR